MNQPTVRARLSHRSPRRTMQRDDGNPSRHHAANAKTRCASPRAEFTGVALTLLAALLGSGCSSGNGGSSGSGDAGGGENGGAFSTAGAPDDTPANAGGGMVNASGGGASASGGLSGAPGGATGQGGAQASGGMTSNPGSGGMGTGMALSDATCVGKNDIIASNGKLVVQGNPGSFDTSLSPFVAASGNNVDGTVGQIASAFRNTTTGITVTLTNPVSQMAKGQPFATSAGQVKDLLHPFPTLVFLTLDGMGQTVQTCSIVGEATPNDFATVSDGSGHLVDEARFSFTGYCNEDAAKRAITGCVAVGPL